MARVAVNVDHVATVRQARGIDEPDPVHAAAIAELAGAEGISCHLREDRRHINDRDLSLLRQTVKTKLKINQETGEYLLAGIGELHLEIALKDLKRDYNLDVTESQPTVVYRASIRDSVGPYMGKSPNKHNRVFFNFSPLDSKIIELIRNGDISVITSQRKMEEVLIEKAEWTQRQARSVFAINENANMMIDTTVGIQGLREVKEHISGGFNWALQQGPLAGEIVRGLLVDMVDINLHEDPVHRGPAQMMPAVRGAVYAGMLSARPTLLEPIYKIQIRVPTGP